MDDADLCTAQMFREHLKKEKLRAERATSPFALLVFDVCCRSEQEDHRMKGLGYLAAVMAKCTRASDTRGWYHQDGKECLGIILPDTLRKGALQVVEKIEASFKKHLLQRDGRETDSMWLVCKIYWHDSNHNSMQRNGSGSDAGQLQGKESNPLHSESQDTNSTTALRTMAPSVVEKNPGSTPSHTEQLFSEIHIAHPEKLCELLAHRLPGWKRAVDIAGALVGLIVSSPIMLFIALLIKITSRGPIFYRQERIGYLGKQFKCLKFRSMRIHADESVHRNHLKDLISNGNGSNGCEKPMTKIRNDPRVTRLGRLLRAWCLDELPQLINVLRGEMSLIGPRPPIEYEVEEYQDWHKQRLNAVPGITGLWQVNGKNAMTFEQMVRVDVQYMRNLSFWLDMKILAKTIPTVLRIGMGTKSVANCQEG